MFRLSIDSENTKQGSEITIFYQFPRATINTTGYGIAFHNPWGLWNENMLPFEEPPWNKQAAAYGLGFGGRTVISKYSDDMFCLHLFKYSPAEKSAKFQSITEIKTTTPFNAQSWYFFMELYLDHRPIEIYTLSNNGLTLRWLHPRLYLPDQRAVSWMKTSKSKEFL